LTDVVTERVLQSVGGKERGAQMVQQYREKFVKGYLA
jgi:hypothetical protein